MQKGNLVRGRPGQKNSERSNGNKHHTRTRNTKAAKRPATATSRPSQMPRYMSPLCRSRPQSTGGGRVPLKGGVIGIDSGAGPENASNKSRQAYCGKDSRASKKLSLRLARKAGYGPAKGVAGGGSGGAPEGGPEWHRKLYSAAPGQPRHTIGLRIRSAPSGGRVAKQRTGKWT